MKIGFIGMGIMGSRMAHNILKGGHEVVIYNRTKEKAASLLEDGAMWAESISALANECPVVITMLANPEVVQKVVIGPEGLLENMGEGGLWIDSSTVNPSFSKEMAQQAKGRNIRFMDAPVAGTKGPAEKGELVFLVGGAEDDVKEAQPLFDLMGKKTIHMGEVGSGSSIKILVNLMLAQTLVAFSETIALGKAMGLEQETLLNVLLNVPVTPAYLNNVRPKFESMDFDDVNFPLQLMKKDLHMVSTTAYEREIPMPSAVVAREIFTQAARHGLGDKDFSAVFGWINEEGS